MTILQYFLCFFIYAFLGYVCEVVYCSICSKKLVNRGYLYLPICPIYGFGAIIILFTMSPLYSYWYLVLLLGILLTSTLEYITSYIMEIIFHMRWWDYSNRLLNINGRVCLKNSLMFGALVIVVIYGIQPVLVWAIDQIPKLVLLILDIVFIIFTCIDLVLSTIKNINIAKVISKLTELKEDASDKINNLKEEASQKFAETKEYFKGMALVQKFKTILSKYPNVHLRKFGKKRESVEDLFAYYEDLKKEDSSDVDN